MSWFNVKTCFKKALADWVLTFVSNISLWWHLNDLTILSFTKKFSQKAIRQILPGIRFQHHMIHRGKLIKNILNKLDKRGNIFLTINFALFCMNFAKLLIVSFLLGKRLNIFFILIYCTEKSIDLPELRNWHISQ